MPPAAVTMILVFAVPPANVARPSAAVRPVAPELVAVPPPNVPVPVAAEIPNARLAVPPARVARPAAAVRFAPLPLVAVAVPPPNVATPDPSSSVTLTVTVGPLNVATPFAAVSVTGAVVLVPTQRRRGFLRRNPARPGPSLSPAAARDAAGRDGRGCRGALEVVGGVARERCDTGRSGECLRDGGCAARERRCCRSRRSAWPRAWRYRR